MKRTIALVLTLLFVLAMLPTVNNAKADEIRSLSIAIESKPDTLVYEVGEKLDLDGLTFNYYDGVQQDPELVEFATAGVYVTTTPTAGHFTTSILDGYEFDSDDVGNKTITVTYNAGTPEGHTVDEKPTATFTITVVSAEVGYLDGLSIETDPSKMIYYEGETFDPSGLTLRAHYTSGSDPDVSLSDCTFSPDTDYPLTLADSYDSVGSTGGVTVVYSKTYTAKTLYASDVVEIEVKAAATTITFTDVSLNFAYSEIGDTKSITCKTTVSGTEGAPASGSVTWGSSDPEVATVDSTGAVTAVAPGSVIITATTRGSNLQAICAVTVADNVIPITNFILNKTELTLGYVSPESGVPATEQLEVTYSPSNTTQKGISWVSDTPTVATVDDNGIVTAVGAGTATITATSTAASLTATCEVTVIDVNVDSITISQESATLYAGSSLTLDAYVLPLNASNPTITWGTSDSTKATVVDGVVTTKVFSTDSDDYPAKVTITATAGSYSASCVITLKYATQLTSVSLNKTSASMSVGDTMTLTATTRPSTATNATLKWTSSDTSVATVDSSGKITALAAGNVTITVSATDGSDKYAECSISVSTVNVLIVSLSSTSLSLVEGNSATLTASVYPSNATNSTIQWSSSNTSIATVDSSGTVTARNVTGYTIITASATDGSGKFAECVVIAKAKIAVTGITLNYGTSLDLLLGDSTTLVATVLPSTATNSTVTWSSSNTSVATIDSDGLLSSVALGETTITATADGKSVTMAVTVTNSEYNYGVAANFRRRVNVRASASGLSKLVGYAYLGDTFKILGKTGNWYYIQYNNTTKAYIWANYINASKTSSGYTSAGSTTSTSTSTTTTTPTTVTITNCLYAVNVRSGPGTTYDRLGKAALGATYTYLGLEGDWYKVQYTSSTIGYIYATFISAS